jgi:hypothetical protein
VSSYWYITEKTKGIIIDTLLILLHMCPHTAIYVSSYTTGKTKGIIDILPHDLQKGLVHHLYAKEVYTPLYMCPHDTIYDMCPHTGDALLHVT